ncbi:MAG: carboxymuconolactone decarboxylase family protein [Bdellovibrionales bacterium]|nr:carboxymuconolactone decarboxylase family protein [Bdellovibrionales bacterium]
MSAFETYRENLKDYAKDIRLNLSTVLAPEGAPGLSPKQIATIALACAYSAGAKGLTEVLRGEFATTLGDAELEAAKGAAVIMAMNNVFYRTQHHAANEELKKLPARLRMNIIGKPGIEKVDFELACLAVSAIGGCDRCVNSHVDEVLKAGLSVDAAHSAIRIAATLNAAALAEAIG